VADWLEYEDRDEPGWRWRLHAGFLLSSYECIFGRGCKGAQGVAAVGCCALGTPLHPEHDPPDWQVEDFEHVAENVGDLTAEEWQHREEGLRDGWHAPNGLGDIATVVVDGACIFHNDPSWPAGGGCAFHVAAARRGESFVDWKPDTCWRVPLQTVDVPGEQVTEVRPTRQGDWDAEGTGDASVIDWWCTSDPIAYVGTQPVYVTMEEELRRILGDEVYAELARDLEARRGPKLVTLPMAAAE
jgi:hypothetical protein